MNHLGKSQPIPGRASAGGLELRADKVNMLEIGSEDEGQRLDNFLMRVCKGVPKSHVYRVIRDGEVRVNRGRVTVDYRLVAGDQLRVPPIRVALRAPQVVPGAEFPVLHEDGELLIVNKPVGVAVHGGSGVSFGVIEQLRAARPQARYLELVHRLDRETSGILMLAKKRSALVNLHGQIKAGTTNKRYLALVAGRVMNPRQHLRMPLFKFTDANGERQVRVTGASDPNAMTAHTIVSVNERFAELPVDPADATLVECDLRTGRTHQIRVHLASSGHPILGDPKYGDFALNKLLARHGLKRMFLHAARLEIDHPVTGERLAIEAPLPAECLNYLEKLRHA